MAQQKNTATSTEPQQVNVAAPEAPETKKKSRKLEKAFYVLEYFLLPLWSQKYYAYKKWADGNEDRMDSANEKFRIALTTSFFFWVSWWLVLAGMSDWSIQPWIVASFFIGIWLGFFFSFTLSIPWWILVIAVSGESLHSSWYTLWFIFLSWALACLTLNIYCCGIGKWPGTFAIPDWKKYLTSKERLHWTEFPEACPFIEPSFFAKAWHRIRYNEKLLPTKRKATFTLGTDGQKWIEYGWYGGNVEYIKTGRFVFGDPTYDPVNGLRGLMVAAASENNFFICLDGDKFGGVNFGHLKSIPSCLVYENRDDLIKAIKWTHREMAKRKKNENHPRIVLVCDQKMMEVYEPGYWVETVKQMFYHWHEVRDEMIDIIRHGSELNIFVIGIVEPSDRITSMQAAWLPYMLSVNFYYYQPVTNEKGTIWVSPHPNHYKDVFSIMDGDDRVIGKFPCVPEQEAIALFKHMAENETEETRILRVKAKFEIPQIDIEKKAEEKPSGYVPLWKRIGMRNRPVEIKPGEAPLELGATEEFYQLHHAPKNGTNGHANGVNGKQKEIELEGK